MKTSALLGIATLITAQAAYSQISAVEQCRTFRLHGKTASAKSCFAGLTQNQDSFLRADGYFGLGQFEEANNEFRVAYKAQPRSAAVKSEWGRLYLEHQQPADAAKLFEEALELDQNYVPAYLGLARVFARNFDKRAVELVHEALKRDEKSAPAHELLAYLALEDGDAKTASTEARQALEISPEALAGLSVLASIDWLNDKAQSEWMDRILKINPVYGEAYATGAHFLEINYRYEDAIPFYRKALALDGELWAARSKLGVDLMRLGQDDEAKQQLRLCYAAHYRDAETVNSLRLLDSLRDYQVFQSGGSQLLLNKKEADLLRPYVEPHLRHAISTYEVKYKLKLPRPVRLEIYPNHEDFIVRTLGLPGQGGLLGVTFGNVVAMDSPSARAAGEFNWGSTLWHELSHVYVLTATHNLVPRWFTEGVAVHEEGAFAPEWGDRLTPDIVLALKKKMMLPVADLDRGFVRPQFRGQVLVSYFQAGKMCDYIVQRWGNDAILGMMRSYAGRKSTPEAIEQNLHESANAFDKDFGAWLEKTTADAMRNFETWEQDLKAGYAALEAGKTDEAMRLGLANAGRYPEYVGDHSNYELLARAYLTKQDKPKAADALQHYRDRGGSNVQALKDLAKLETELNRPVEAVNTLNKLNFVYLEDEESHRLLGQLALKAGDAVVAIREGEAVIALHPTDGAAAHYELARALSAAHRRADAKDEVVLALEAAPDFKPAQRLLLELSQ